MGKYFLNKHSHFSICIGIFKKYYKTNFVSSFPCHSHSDLGNVYLLVLSSFVQTYRIKIAESTMTMTMTMTGKTRYKVGPLELLYNPVYGV